MASASHDEGEVSRSAQPLPAVTFAQDLLESSPDAFLILDAEWRIIYANGAAERFPHKSRLEFLKKNFWEEWPAVLASDYETQYRHAMEARVPVLFDHLDLDARDRCVHIHAFPCQSGLAVQYREAPRLQGGEMPARELACSEDTSEVQQRLASIVESSDDAIISKNLQGIILSWNRGAERIFGYTPEEAIGQPVSMLAAPERADELPNILERIKRGERVEHYVTKRRTKDGRILSISLTVSPIRDRHGKVIGASKVARDITEADTAQAVLREMNEQLRRANADLRQFAFSAAHDLQEPLRMVSLFTQLLQRKYRGQLSPEADEHMTNIVEAAHRMNRLLHDLLTYAEVSTAAVSNGDVADPNQAVRVALENLAAAITESGAIVTCEELPLVVMRFVDLEQLFQNLIGNAVKYRGQDPPRIAVSARRRGRDWVFSVKDNGIGIDSRYGEQIFGLFKRLHTANEFPGTGLGLAICQRIVERAGGRIWVESELGRGSTFFFTIPIQEQEWSVSG
jgi:PAS domain S-box-containing protein